MPLTLVTIPCLSDNYAYLVHDAATGDTAVIDVPEAEPVLAALKREGWALTDILITHHHSDHIGGVDQLRAATGAKVSGAAADAHRLPALDVALHEGDHLTVGTSTASVLDVSGHSLGHIAFYFADSDLAFTGDSLMALGCGRLFEGTPAQMWTSLNKLAALPDQTRICSGHDYSRGNTAFALTIEPANHALDERVAYMAEDRAANRPMAIVPLSVELATNPFLRANDTGIKALLGMSKASDVEVFTEIRHRKDVF
jgi:hydroxyacylglutathione hydrolase